MRESAYVPGSGRGRGLGTVERGKVADLNAAAAHAGPMARAAMSAAGGEPMRQNAHVNHDLDVLAAVGPEEGRFAPQCAEHTGGGCC